MLTGFLSVMLAIGTATPATAVVRTHAALAASENAWESLVGHEVLVTMRDTGAMLRGTLQSLTDTTLVVTDTDGKRHEIDRATVLGVRGFRTRLPSHRHQARAATGLAFGGAPLWIAGGVMLGIGLWSEHELPRYGHPLEIRNPVRLRNAGVVLLSIGGAALITATVLGIVANVRKWEAREQKRLSWQLDRLRIEF